MSQKGFTLVEILVAMLVGGLVMTASLQIFYQLVWGTLRSQDKVLSLTDVNYAIMLIKRDIQMCQYTSLTDGDPVPQSWVSLSWVDHTSFAADNSSSSHYSNYTLSGTELLRDYDSTTRVVGRHITSIGFTQNNRVISCNITATGPGATQRGQTLEFKVRMRSEVMQ